MDYRDRQAIEDLFRRLDEVEQSTGPRDPEAEAFINDGIRRQPGAPYYMAQTIVVQAEALEVARQRIEELERGRSGGFFDNLFGGGRAAPQRAPARERGPWDRRSEGGGFLAGAAQTAVGVAGGVFLGSLIAGAFAGGAQAAEAQPGADDPANDAGGNFDTGSDDFGGEGDFGDFGGGDFGGGFD
ncbi:MAG: DUF2076 domain-containing protein [Bauldia sp.]|nr:DUF2076 domain-containing protein [Bauldia sp.]